jgi:hypothetical protein
MVMELIGTLQAAIAPPAQSAGYWAVLPTALWFALAVVLLIIYHSRLQDLLTGIVWRIRCGGAVKLGSLELPASYVTPKGDISRSGRIESRADTNRARWNEREKYYGPNRRIFLVHRLAISKEPGQLYDVELYLIPHKDATLACVARAEYYFGPYWGEKVFVSIDRPQAFSISTSAYGPFVATAEIVFTDGATAIVSRYIDFEMGPAGSQSLIVDKAKPAV